MGKVLENEAKAAQVNKTIFFSILDANLTPTKVLDSITHRDDHDAAFLAIKMEKFDNVLYTMLNGTSQESYYTMFSKNHSSYHNGGGREHEVQTTADLAKYPSIINKGKHQHRRYFYIERNINKRKKPPFNPTESKRGRTGIHSSCYYGERSVNDSLLNSTLKE